MQQYSQIVTELPSEKRSIEMLERAEEYVDLAATQFKDLKERKGADPKADQKGSTDPKLLGYDPKLAEQREKHCGYVKSAVSRKLTMEKTNQADQRIQLEESKRKREQEELARMQQLAEEKRRHEEHQEKLLEQRRQMQEELLHQQQKEAAEKQQQAERVKVRLWICLR